MDELICAAVFVPLLKKMFFGHRHKYAIQAMNDELYLKRYGFFPNSLDFVKGYLLSSGSFLSEEDAFKKYGEFISEDLY